MNTATAALIGILRADDDLADIVGTRIRTGSAAPTDALPYCLLWQILGTPIDAIDGETDTESSLVQIDIYAARFGGENGADAIARLVRNALSSFGRGTIAGIYVDAIIRVNGPRQTAEPSTAGAGAPIARVSFDFRITHSTEQS